MLRRAPPKQYLKVITKMHAATPKVLVEPFAIPFGNRFCRRLFFWGFLFMPPELLPRPTHAGNSVIEKHAPFDYGGNIQIHYLFYALVGDNYLLDLKQLPRLLRYYGCSNEKKTHLVQISDGLFKAWTIT